MKRYIYGKNGANIFANRRPLIITGGIILGIILLFWFVISLIGNPFQNALERTQSEPVENENTDIADVVKEIGDIGNDDPVFNLPEESGGSGIEDITDPSLQDPTLPNIATELIIPSKSETLGGKENFAWSAGQNVNFVRFAILDGRNNRKIVEETDFPTTRRKATYSIPTTGNRVLIVLVSSFFDKKTETKTYSFKTEKPAATPTPTVKNVPATLTSPSEGSTFTSSTVQFKWIKGVNISTYEFEIIDKEDNNVIYNKNNISSGNSSLTVSGLPKNGHELKVELKSNFSNGESIDKNYDFRAHKGIQNKPAEIYFPTEGAQFTSTTQEFRWQLGQNIAKYRIRIINEEDDSVLKEKDNLSPSTNKTSFSGLPDDGRDIEVALKSYYIDDDDDTENYDYKAYEKEIIQPLNKLTFQAIGNAQNTTLNPAIHVYVNKKIHSAITIGGKEQYVINDLNIDPGDLLSIAFPNDRLPDPDSQFENIDRSIDVEKIWLDDLLVFSYEHNSESEEDKEETTFFDVVYDRANMFDGTPYPEFGKDWGDTPQGYWDNKGKINDIANMEWNGSINIIWDGTTSSNSANNSFNIAGVNIVNLDNQKLKEEKSQFLRHIPTLKTIKLLVISIFERNKNLINTFTK